MSKIRILPVCMAALALTPCFAVYAVSEGTENRKSHGKIVYTDVEGMVELHSEDISYLAQKVSSIPDRAFEPSLFSMAGDEEENIIFQQDGTWVSDDVWESEMDTTDVEIVTVDAVAVCSEGGVDGEWLSVFEEFMKAGKVMKAQMQEAVKDLDMTKEAGGMGDEDETEEQTGMGDEENAKKQTGVGDEENAKKQTAVGSKTDEEAQVWTGNSTEQGKDEDSGRDPGSISANGITDN